MGAQRRRATDNSLQLEGLILSLSVRHSIEATVDGRPPMPIARRSRNAVTLAPNWNTDNRCK